MARHAIHFIVAPQEGEISSLVVLSTVCFAAAAAIFTE